MALTKIQRGMIGNGAVIVPDNLYTTNTGTSELYLSGDGSWRKITGLDSTGSNIVSNLTVTNVLTFGDGTKISSANSATVTWSKIADITNANGPLNVLIGRDAGHSNTLTNIDFQIALGYGAGTTVQTDSYPLNYTYQDFGIYSGAISIGNYHIIYDRSVGGNGNPNDMSLQTNQGLNAVSIGTNAGRTNQGDYSVAIGARSGEVNQGENSVAIGHAAGGINNSVAIGAATIAGEQSVHIGSNAGQVPALGANSVQSVVIGGQSANKGVGNNSVVVGGGAGNARYYSTDNFYDPIFLDHNIIIGNAGNGVYSSPVNNVILIGNGAGTTLGNDENAQGAVNRSIILNATGDRVVSEQESFYVAPIRASTGTSILYYNPITYEVTRGSVASFDPDQGVL